MKKFLGLIVYAAVMFGVTAGLGMFMLKKSTPHATESEHGAESEDGEHDAAADGHGSKVASSDHGAPSEEGDDSSHGRDDHGSASHEPKRTASADDQLPVAVRATPMSVEEIVRMGMSLKSRDETVRKREAALKEMESQQKLAIADMQTAQQEIEYLLAQAIDQREATEELQARLKEQEKTLASEREAIAADRSKLNDGLEKLNRDQEAIASRENDVKTALEDLAFKRRELDTAQKTLNSEREQQLKAEQKFSIQKAAVDDQKRLNETESERLKNLEIQLQNEQKALAQGKKGASVASEAVAPTDSPEFKSTVALISSLEPEKAAAYLSNIAKGNNLDYVLDVLRAMDDKNAANVVDAISDEELASSILLRLSNRNNATKSAEKP